MGKTSRGIMLVILSAMGFGLMPVFALLAYHHGITVSSLLFIRFSLGFVILMGYLAATRKLARISRKQAAVIFLLGGIGYTAQSTFYLEAVRLISPSLAALFLYTYPLFVAVLSAVVDRHRITARTAVSILVSLAGVTMVLGVSIGAIDMTGVLLAFGATAVYSVYIVAGNRVVKQVPPIMLSGLIMGFAAVGSGMSGAAAGTLDFHFSSGVWLPIAGLVFVSTVLAIIAFFSGLALLGPTRASIMSMTEPLFTLAGTAFAFGEILTLPQAIGGIAILAGAVFSIGDGRDARTTAG